MLNLSLELPLGDNLDVSDKIEVNRCKYVINGQHSKRNITPERIKSISRKQTYYIYYNDNSNIYNIIVVAFWHNKNTNEFIWSKK